jgi:putative peptidoglycan lipid II flippase
MVEGSIQSLTYGFTLMVMAQAAIAQSVAIAAMPTFSAQHALGKVDEMRSSLASALRGMFLLALPASVGLILLGKPIIALLFERGEFTSTITDMTAFALAWFAAGLVGHSIMEVLTRAFYAQQDTKTPVIIGTIAMGLNVIFSILFSRWFAAIGWFPLGGLALANSLATALEATALFIFMRQRLNGIEGKSIADGAWRVALSALGMGIGLGVWIHATGSLTRWLVVLGGVALGGIIYASGAAIFKIPEIKIIFDIVTKRLLRARNDNDYFQINH